MKLILASNSPRRKQLLTEYGFTFTIVPSEYEEKVSDRSPKDTVTAFALGKAQDVYDKLSPSDKQTAVVLGADTVVALDGNILGKPTDKDNAKQMLKLLSGKSHSVYTGYCIIKDGKPQTFAEQSIVTFNTLTDAQIDEYVASGKPLDKAGAYGIQDGYNLVKSYKGSFNNIVGLPVEVFAEKLKQLLKD